MSPKLSLAILLPSTMAVLAYLTVPDLNPGPNPKNEVALPDSEPALEDPEPKKDRIPVTWLQLDDATAEIFESWPPGASDYAVFFRHLSDENPKTIAVLPTLSWSALDPILKQILAKQLASLPIVLGGVLDAQSVVPITVERAAELPQITKIEGDRQSIPEFTGFGLMPHDAFLKEVPFGFTQIEFGDSVQITHEWIELPLLARFEDQVIPAMPLMTLIQSLGIALESVEVKLGETISIGDREIPIDVTGRCRFSRDAVDTLITRSAESVLPPPIENPFQPGRPSAPEPLDGIIILGEEHAEAPLITLDDGTTLSQDRIFAAGIAAVAQGSFWEPPAEVAQPEAVENPEPPSLLLAIEPYGIPTAFWFTCFALGGLIILQSPSRARRAAWIGLGLTLPVAVAPFVLHPAVPLTCIVAACLSLMREGSDEMS